MDTKGFFGDTFSSGFGDFFPARKRAFDRRQKEYEINNFQENQSNDKKVCLKLLPSNIF